MLEKSGVAGDQQFFASLEAVLEVLPVGRTFGGIELDGDLAASGTDFEVLEKLRRLAFAAQVDEPEQLSFLKDAVA
jgi:putative DNA methylase